MNNFNNIRDTSLNDTSNEWLTLANIFDESGNSESWSDVDSWRSQIGVRVADYNLKEDSEIFNKQQKMYGLGDAVFSSKDLMMKKIESMSRVEDEFRDSLERDKLKDVGNRVLTLTTMMERAELSRDSLRNRLEYQDWDEYKYRRNRSNIAIAKSILRHYRKRGEDLNVDRGDRINIDGVERLNEMIESGVEGVSKSNLIWGRGQVDFYHLNGAPFNFLISVLGMELNGRHRDGSVSDNNAEEILRSFDKTRLELESEGVKTSEYISTSLISNDLIDDTLIDKIPHRVMGDGNTHLIFGYSDVGANEVIGVNLDGYGDANIVNNNRLSPSVPLLTRVIDNNIDIEDIKRVRNYIRDNNMHPYINEVAIDRYCDGGSGINFLHKSRVPDFLISIGEMITKDMLEIATRLSIPIVNIDRDKYRVERNPAKNESVIENVGDYYI